MNGATGPISGLNTLADWQDAFRRQTTDAGRAACAEYVAALCE